jgi:hypothetical protein
MILHSIPESPEARLSTDLFSWEHIVRQAEEVLIVSIEYEQAQRAIQPLWKRMARFAGEALIATGTAISAIPIVYLQPVIVLEKDNNNDNLN